MLARLTINSKTLEVDKEEWRALQIAERTWFPYTFNFIELKIKSLINLKKLFLTNKKKERERERPEEKKILDFSNILSTEVRRK